jgi:hypothetical protein
VLCLNLRSNVRGVTFSDEAHLPTVGVAVREAPNWACYTVSQLSQPTGTTNGTTTAGSSGGTGSNPTTKSSQVAGVPVSSTTLLAPGNNFGEVAIQRIVT